jgi:hypothetical protein
MDPLSIASALIGPVFDTIGKIIDRAWPDPTEAAKVKAQIFQAQQDFAKTELQASLQLALSQMQVNQAEAASGSWYAAGWRPTVGYIGCLALMWQFFLYPITNYICIASGARFTPPQLGDLGPLISLLTGMLGLGIMRTWEKAKGIST